MTDQDDAREKLAPDFPLGLFHNMMNPEIIGCVQDVQQVLAIDLPESERYPFLLFHNFITNPQPRFITEWRTSPKDERWYLALVDGLNWATRNAYACVLYHFQRLSILESEVMQKLSKRNYVNVLGNSAVGVGNTLIWDFEYQAFVFAYRRCLDYLTRGLAAFFKHDFHSFNELPKSLKSLKPQSVADALAAVHKKHRENFDFVISVGETRSVRDKISHYEWVSAGSINLNRYGLILVGGGENLPFTMGEHNTARLADALGLRVRMLKACIDEMLTVFVNEARAWEASRV